MVVINPLFRLHPIIFCVLTHSKTEWMWLIYFTPHNQFSNWCISLTDAFRQFWRFLTPHPPYLTPTAVLIISLNKPPLNNVYPIRYDLIFLAEEFRRFLWFRCWTKFSLLFFVSWHILHFHPIASRFVLQ